jgi:hypothetical protein
MKVKHTAKTVVELGSNTKINDKGPVNVKRFVNCNHVSLKFLVNVEVRVKDNVESKLKSKVASKSESGDKVEIEIKPTINQKSESQSEFNVEVKVNVEVIFEVEIKIFKKEAKSKIEVEPMSNLKRMSMLKS